MRADGEGRNERPSVAAGNRGSTRSSARRWMAEGGTRRPTVAEGTRKQQAEQRASRQWRVKRGSSKRSRARRWRRERRGGSAPSAPVGRAARRGGRCAGPVGWGVGKNSGRPRIYGTRSLMDGGGGRGWFPRGRGSRRRQRLIGGRGVRAAKKKGDRRAGFGRREEFISRRITVGNRA